MAAPTTNMKEKKNKNRSWKRKSSTITRMKERDVPRSQTSFPTDGEPTADWSVKHRESAEQSVYKRQCLDEGPDVCFQTLDSSVPWIWSRRMVNEKQNNKLRINHLPVKDSTSAKKNKNRSWKRKSADERESTINRALTCEAALRKSFRSYGSTNSTKERKR